MEMAQVSVRILEKEYQFACPASERNDLLNAAEFLNAKMRQIRDTGKVVGLDRTAIMAALNLANELLQSHTQEDLMDSGLELRIKTMRQRVESALESGKQLEL
jgi:cell division protein ZapA